MVENKTVDRQKSWSRGWRQGLTTPRLIIRGLQPGDHAAWRRGYADRQPASRAYDRGPAPAKDLTLTRFGHWQTLQKRNGRRDECYVFWLFLPDMSTTVGAIDISTLQRDNNAWANLGYVVHNQHQRQGYGREALAVLLPFAFEHLGYHRIEAAIRLDNAPAIALAASAKFKREGVRKKFWLDPDGWADHVIYTALRS